MWWVTWRTRTLVVVLFVCMDMRRRTATGTKRGCRGGRTHSSFQETCGWNHTVGALPFLTGIITKASGNLLNPDSYLKRWQLAIAYAARSRLPPLSCPMAMFTISRENAESPHELTDAPMSSHLHSSRVLSSQPPTKRMNLPPSTGMTSCGLRAVHHHEQGRTGKRTPSP